jgi:hypothetical protein
MNDYNMNTAGTFAAVVGFGAVILTPIIAWATHLVWIIGALASDSGATTGQIVLGCIGAFMPPVGVVHGVMIWLGVGA